MKRPTLKELKQLFQRGLYDKKYHIIYGRHSNIPECCIEFFINYSNRFDDVTLRKYNTWFHEVQAKLGPTWSYKPCPKCVITGRMKRLHVCQFPIFPSCQDPCDFYPNCPFKERFRHV